MATVVDEVKSAHVGINNTLLDAIVNSVESALTMCDISARCVGISRIPQGNNGLITGMIGVHGKVSGFITVNMAERFAIHAVSGLLQEKYTDLSSQVVDGAGEITNIIAGGVKSTLSSTEWGFGQMTVPSVIVGNGYSIAYANGLEFLNVCFEHNDPEAVLLEDRLIQVSISLLAL